MNKTAYIDFKAVRAALDFETVLSHYAIELVGQGEQCKIICPFHDDHRPSCGVNLKRKIFQCFSCGAKGNVMEFVALMEGHDPETTNGIRQGAHAALKIMGLDEGAFKADAASKTNSKTKAAIVSKAQPVDAAETAPAKRTSRKKDDTQEQEDATNKPLTFTLDLQSEHEFFEQRGLDAQTIKRFGLGYCNKGIMAGRICIPLHNERGELVAYAGRHTQDKPDKDTPRYKFPKGFQKGHVLYNLHRIAECRPKHVVLVEGYWSVMRLDAAGIAAVASLGTAVSDQQVSLLSELGVRYITVLFDGDEGGRSGALEAVARLSELMYVRRLDLPDGIKPDSMSNEYLDRLR